MTAYCSPIRRTNPFIAIVLAFVLLAVVASWHAVRTHGPDALSAQNCFNRGGAIQPSAYLDPLTGRKLSICNQGGHWFVSIDGPDGGNITMFPRNFARCLRDVIDYAKRSGFTRPVKLY